MYNSISNKTPETGRKSPVIPFGNLEIWPGVCFYLYKIRQILNHVCAKTQINLAGTAAQASVQQPRYDIIEAYQ